MSDLSTKPTGANGQTPTPAASLKTGAGVQITIGQPSTTKEDDGGIGVELIKAGGPVLAAAFWPVILYLICALFKEQIGNLIDRIKSLKAGGVEISTEELIEQLPNPPENEQEQVDEALHAPVQDFVQIAPIDAIVTSWVSVERALLRLSDKAFPNQTASISVRHDPRPNTPQRITMLRQGGMIDARVAGQVRELSMIRNKAVHDPDQRLSPEAVERYVANAAALTAELDDLARGLG